MRRSALTALLLATLLAAPARGENEQYDFDLIHRPRGTTDATVNAGVQVATRACDPWNERSYGSKTFLNCMRSKGYKFLLVEHQKSPADPYFSSNVKLAPGHFIDHDTGLDCHREGWGDSCESPSNGTVHYFDPDQDLACTRTSIVSICTNM